MTQLIRLISKYSILLVLSTLISKIVFYYSSFYLHDISFDEKSIWFNISKYIIYFFQLVIAIFLLIDLKRLKMKHYFIALVGLFYPIMGITALLLIILYNDRNNMVV